MIRPRGDAASLATREERLAAGKALRHKLALDHHARWKAPAGRRDPIDVLKLSARGRVPELVPIRHGRMLPNPFTFLRGSAGLMASDLASMANTGIRVQVCGDCHLLNFGLFATPERNLIFDINDFDETLPAPWEWDLKRLAISFVVASRENGHSDKQAKAAAVECTCSYRTRLRKYSKKTPLDVWYERLGEHDLIRMASTQQAVATREKLAKQAHKRIGDGLFPKIARPAGGRLHLIDEPPLLFHPKERNAVRQVEIVLKAYRATLPDERRVLYDRYRIHDVAFKVVGIGSVGTRCFVGLFCTADQDPLLLQFKQANASVLEPYAGRSDYPNHGQRIVQGQRLMQSASDIFLGWSHGAKGYDFYGRQLRDMKMSVEVDTASHSQMMAYAEICGWTLARAHAKSGDAALISGYLGKSDTFDRAMGAFALAYADQVEKDHEALRTAVKRGRIEAIVGESE